jgi:hypothetical protein
MIPSMVTIFCHWDLLILCFIITLKNTQDPAALLQGYNAMHGTLLALEVLFVPSKTLQ